MIDLRSSEGNQTAKGRVWQFPLEEKIADDLLAACDGNDLVAQLLRRRGISDGAMAKAFLSPQFYVPTNPLELPDVARATSRITQAIEAKEHVTIYGDYDVDGITGTSVLMTVLRELGADVDFYIPNRADEGYGLNLKAVSILASKRRTKLIITCDCGVSNFAEINFAKSLGVDTIVLDHHSMPDFMPPAVAIVHPKLRSEDHALFHLPGVGVAYKVCEALLTDRGLGGKVPDLLDFVTLGMIADLVPLVKENRYLVQVGLPALVKSKRPGIQALLKQVKRSEDADLVGFGIAPRINAVGRLADARVAVELLTTDDAQLAAELAGRLQRENEKRQEICERIFIEANHLIAARSDLQNDKAIAIYKDDWHHGVVGIVASRLVEKYGLPVFIAERDDDAGVIKGSARSIEGVDLYEVLKANEQLLTKWGGHKMAAGFSTTLEKGDILCRALLDTCNRLLPGEVFKPKVEIDAVLKPMEVDLPLTKSFARLGPFGMANKKPIFCLQNLRCQSTRILGKDGKHLRVTFVDEVSQSIFEGLLWNYHGKAPEAGTMGDIVFTPESNVFNNRERLQLHIIDWRGFGAVFFEVSENVQRVMPITGNVHQALEEGSPSNVPTPLIEVAAPEPNSDSITAKSHARTFSSQITWRDLREYNVENIVLSKAVSKFGDALTIFSESNGQAHGFDLRDRTNMEPRANLLLWQYPPSINVLQEVLLLANPTHVYVCGGAPEDSHDVSSFLKKLVGIIRYTASKKEGQVPANKLAAALASTPVATALGMSLLQKAGAIDWYVEDGMVFLDLLGPPNVLLEDIAEHRQIDRALKQIAEFRNWFASSKLNEIQLAAMPNQIWLPEESMEPTTVFSEQVEAPDVPIKTCG